MGKPSSTQFSINLRERKSDRSLKSNSSYASYNNKLKSSLPLGVSKAYIAMRNRKSKTKNNIEKLFNKLRNESGVSSSNNTIVFLEDSQNNTVIKCNESPKSGKRKSASSCDVPNKKPKCDDNQLIVIDDDSLLNEANTPVRTKPRIDCSTPISTKDSKNMQELIMKNISLSQLNNNSSKTQNYNDNGNETKEINRDSYLTIDLTAESEMNKTNPDTVIDLATTVESPDCMLVSISKASLSMSGDSDVTVLNTPKTTKKKNVQKQLTSGIARLNESEKGKLLEYLTEKIFNGCTLPNTVKASLQNIAKTINKSTETIEDKYIKEVILGAASSRNSIGSNIYHPERDPKNKTGLRMIVIDGSNVAMEHTRGREFSVNGLKICIDYFLKRGHQVKAFVPRFRCKYGKSTNPRLLDQLERQGLVVYTPSREVKGRTITPYDDRYIIQCAAEFDGVIVTGDNYKDLINENPRWRYVIENRLLPFTWVQDMIMFPKDPLGRYGPTLEQFLSHTKDNAPPIITFSV